MSTYIAETLSVNDKPCVLWRPRVATDLPVVFLLGRTDPRDWLTSAEASAQARRFVDYGYWVMAPSTEWGNQDDDLTISTAVFVSATRGKDPARSLFIGHGQGACAALNWAARSHYVVASAFLLSPIIDLSERWTRVPADRPSLEAAFGGTQQSFDEAMAARNPAVEWRSMITRDGLRGRLTMMWSDADTDTPPAVTAAIASTLDAGVELLDDPDPTLADTDAVVARAVEIDRGWDQQPADREMRRFTSWVEGAPSFFCGGDGAASTVLADGRRIWTFADSTTGPVRMVQGEPDGTRPDVVGFRHNSLIIEDSAGEITGEHPASFAAPFDHPNHPDVWWWLLDCDWSPTHDALLVFTNRVELGGLFGTILDSDILVVDPDTFAIDDVVELGVLDRFFVQQCLLDGDTAWVVGYNDDGEKYNLLARVPVVDLLTPSAWRWWDGASFVADVDAAVTLFSTAGEPVIGTGALRRHPTVGWILCASDNLDNLLRIYVAASPVGPWLERDVIQRPAVGTRYNVLAVGYQPKWHPQHDTATHLMLTWNGAILGTEGESTPRRDYSFGCPHFVHVPVPAHHPG
jgi:hypothetical protein